MQLVHHTIRNGADRKRKFDLPLCDMNVSCHRQHRFQARLATLNMLVMANRTTHGSEWYAFLGTNNNPEGRDK